MPTRPSSRRLRWIALIAFGLAACGVSEDAELPPELRDVEVSEQAAIECSPRSDTGYTRGRPTPITVVTVDGKPVELDTANAFHAMREAARVAGVSIRVVSGFRTYAEQAYLYECYTSCSCNSCNLAARPGYSNHNSGTALDLNSSDRGVLSWLRRHGRDYGFEETVSGEPWHWEYTAGESLDTPCRADGSAAPAPSAPAPAGGLELLSPEPGALYGDGVFLRASAPAGASHVRYFDGAREIGASEDSAASFALRHVFGRTGAVELTARAYDDDDQLLAEASVDFRIGSAVRPDAAVALLKPEAGALVRNGFDVYADVGPEVASVEYVMGPYRVGASADRASGFAANVAIQTLGFRVLGVRAFDASGDLVGHAERVVRVAPGVEVAGPALQIVSPRPSADLEDGALVLAAGSTSIRAVSYLLDGASIGRSDQHWSLFPASLHLGRGEHTLTAIGYDAAGVERARHELKLTR